MMRMLAWVNLLQNDGLVNRALSLGGLFHVHVDWLNGRSLVVVLGLVYGYVPVHDPAALRRAGPDRSPACSRPRATSAPAGSTTFRRVTAAAVSRRPSIASRAADLPADAR